MPRPSQKATAAHREAPEVPANTPVLLRGTEGEAKRKTRVSQQDVPAYSLDQSLRVARAIGENYASRPTRPLDVATALNMRPTSSSFRMLTGASIAYGLTEGGYNASTILVTSLARRILEPTVEDDDLLARREAILQPRVMREFLSRYDGARIPREEIARNVLVELGVPRGSADPSLKLILDGARAVGFLREIKGATYVNLQPERQVSSKGAGDADGDSQPPLSGQLESSEEHGIDQMVDHIHERRNDDRARRVFVTHGKNRSFIDTIKDLLTFGELEAVVSVERETVSQPIPDKVMSDMRSCGAAVIHVDAEEKLINQEGESRVVLNPNVLIEIGAAMALYGRRFILLVRDGIQLPSNLQGLFEVR